MPDSRCKVVQVFVLATALVLPAIASAFERDVHFGLTKWLAIQAGFTAQEAEALATGDQRVDSGDMQFIELVPAYACMAKNADSANLVRQHHYPSPVRLPAPADQRAVAAGSDAAQSAALEATKVAPKQASFLLFRFAEAIHAVQDSYSHQGIPDLPRPLGGALACDPALAFAHPHARGGWSSHAADLTYKWPADTVAMAKATYDLMVQFPAIGGATRSPRPWVDIRPLLDGFVRASTKSEKKKWFVAQGTGDVSFLQGTTLADGAEPFGLQWTAHKLTPLTNLQPMQHGVDPGLFDFYRRFFTQWMSTEDFDAAAAAFGAPAARSTTSANAAMPPVELAARLRAWRIRDHGRIAELAHAPGPLTPKQRNMLASIAKERNAIVHYATAADAFFPLEVKGRDAAPLQGFVVAAIQPASNGNEQAVATTKLRHAPYDSVVVLAERIAGSWRIVAVDAIVDH